jgi:hypothetical protein
VLLWALSIFINPFFIVRRYEDDPPIGIYRSNTKLLNADFLGLDIPVVCVAFNPQFVVAVLPCT